MKKAVIFDLDNTLYDYDSAHECGMRELEKMAMERLTLTAEEWRKAFFIGKKEVKERLPKYAAGHNRLLYIENALEYLKVPPAVCALDLYNAYWDTFLASMQLRDGAMTVLEQLRSAGIKMGLCSDLTAHIQYRKLNRLGIQKYFSVIVTSEEAGVEKPDARIFQLILNKLEVSPRDTVMVGDSPEKDIAGARALGILAVFFDPSQSPAASELQYQKIKTLVWSEK